MSEKERQSREELFRLMAEHPELPVVPMVDSDIVADEGSCYWMGSWGAACIREYLRGDERVYFRDDEDIEEVVASISGWDAYELMSNEEAVAAFMVMPWVKAIVVNIDLPE